MTKALGMIETLGLASSIEAADAMLKNANVSLVSQEKVNAALVTILVEGDVSAVQAAVEAGIEVAKRTGALISYNVIARPEIDSSKLFSRELDQVLSTNEENLNDKPSKSKRNKTNPKSTSTKRNTATTPATETEENSQANIQAEGNEDSKTE